MLRSRSLWMAIIGFAALVHLDWHAGRPGDGILDGNLPYHWVLGLVTGASLTWLATRYWPKNPWLAGATVLIVGAALGQGAQPLSEVLLSGSWGGSGLASELRAQGDFLSVAACEVRPEARKPVTHVHGP